MGSWRRQRDFDGPSRKTIARKPPNQFWQPTVPAWEKKFCSMIGSVSWSKLLDSKKYMHLYENVVQWNDSAGEEAFLNAKKRFWAHINSLPCDLSLPDPNEYIDDVDWESQIDPELILDLDRPPVVVEEQNGCLKSNFLLFNEIAPATGWGDAEEDLQKNIGWGDFEEKNANNFPVSYHQTRNPGSGENYWDSNNHNNVRGYSKQWEPRNPKREASGGYNFGYTDNKRDGGWRNEREIKRDRFAYEKQSPPWIGIH